jgi:hypothetical protein
MWLGQPILICQASAQKSGGCFFWESQGASNHLSEDLDPIFSDE